MAGRSPVPTKLLLRLIDHGHRALSTEQERRKAEWHAIVDRTSGTGDYDPGYLEELRTDWPE